MARPERPKGMKMHTLEPAFDPVAAALKQLHQSVADEPVPDDFLRILDDIDAKIAAAAAKSMQ
jgi:Anti-sigma factor NepR